MPRSHPGILVLEGADASGKTTLAQHLVRKYGARYLHLGPYRDVWRWHLGALVYASQLADSGQLVIVDRHWISEIAYGTVYRNGSKYPIAARCFDRLWLRLAAVHVLCVPEDSERQAREHYQRDLEAKGNTYARDRNRDVRRVIAYYRDLRSGNAVHPGDDYLAQWIRFGDFAQRDDVIVYDRFEHGHVLDEFTDRLLKTLRRHRRLQHHLGLCHYTPNFAGHARHARLLIVGEAPSTAGLQREDIKFPFIDRCTHLSAATWLNRALHELGVSETDLVWCNASGPELDELASGYDYAPMLRTIPALALGRVAQHRLEKLRWRRLEHVEHPQYWRRFKHGESYANELRGVIKRCLA